MRQTDPLMGPEPGHGAVLPSTEMRIIITLQNAYRCEEGVNTDVDGPDPFCLLVGTERSPFSPYRWIRTGMRIIRTKHAYCRPKDGQSDRETSGDEHIWAGYCVNGGAAARLKVNLLP